MTTTTHTATGQPTDTATTDTDLNTLRDRINSIDDQLIALWHERSQVSHEVGVRRMASGGTRLALARERQICDKFRTAIGEDGTQLALLLLRAGRGPL
jgi:chorismate mutase